MKFETIPVTTFQQNCTLVWCEKSNQAAIIDPGGEAADLIKEIEKRGLKLETVLLTHGHIDHVGAAKEVAEKLNVEINGPLKEDKFLFEALSQQSEMFNFPNTEPFFPDHWLKDGDVIVIGEIKLNVIHAPGHTPGHVVYFEPESSTVFVGDVLFRGSIGRTDLPGGNHAQLLAAIKERLFPLGDDVVVVPGHGPLASMGTERRMNPFVAQSGTA